MSNCSVSTISYAQPWQPLFLTRRAVHKIVIIGMPWCQAHNGFVNEKRTLIHASSLFSGPPQMASAPVAHLVSCLGGHVIQQIWESSSSSYCCLMQYGCAKRETWSVSSESMLYMKRNKAQQTLWTKYLRFSIEVEREALPLKDATVSVTAAMPKPTVRAFANAKMKFRLDYLIAKMCSDIQKTCTVNMNLNKHFLVPRTKGAIWG
jgi:hypothetical protein